ncbi:hypothetical protein SAMN04489727_1276 [Amycolatopsis tolypomycina]|uniref:PPE family protein n=1 Tax=Amycolatopsis tolypomycina TaxID=208445 RepID=A0A1H4IZX1_9PSEU|nr:hypothetical protein [Amycolatopsis tolypomycina]SEB38918.1 hypothetical protein SAMN04489727_1276 [Amycolatopsis tolypomycina]
MSLLDDAKDGIKNLAHGAEEMVSGAVNAVGDFFRGDVGTQPVPVPEFVEQVRNGNTASWYQGVDKAAALSKSHTGVDHTVSGLLTRLESSWTGAGSDAARQKIQKFRDVTADAATTFTGNGNSLKMVAGSFDTAKHTMDPMPPRPDKSVVDVLTPWTTDTEAAIGNYNNTAAKNLAIYKTYEAQAGAGSSQLTVDYGQLGAFDGGAITVTDTPAGKKPRGTRRDTSTPVTSRADVTPPPPSTTPGSHDIAGARDVTVPGRGEQPLPSDRGGQDTTTAGFTPSPISTGVGPSTLPAPTAPGVSTGGGSSPYLGMGGLTGGVGGLGSDSGAGRAPGGGGRTGAGAPGEGVRGGTTVPSRGAGARGPAGTSGMAPGPGRGKGSEEDQEHQRKYVLDTTLFDEDGNEITDPVNGLPAVPPTIGT